MATLQKIRNRAGLLIVILGIALLAFILTDLFSSANVWVAKFKDRAFSVDGTVVSTGEYQNRITEWEEFQKIILGGSALDENSSAQIRERVYQEMVKEIMLDKEASKLGLSVSREEMTEMVYGNNPSPILTQLPLFVDETGRFSRQVLNSFLEIVTSSNVTQNEQEQAIIQSYKNIWVFLQRMIKYQRLEEKYTSLLAGAIQANDTEAKEQLNDSKYTIQVAYALQPYSSLPDSSVSVSDSEVKALYEKRKNNFRVYNDLAKISYFVRNVIPSQEDVTAADKVVNQAYDALSNNGGAVENIASIVSQYSEVPFQNVFIATRQLQGALADFARNAKVGEINGPVKEVDHFEVYQLLAKTMAPDSVSIQFLAFPLSNETSPVADSVYNVLKEGKDFSTVAQELNQPMGTEAQWVTEMALANSDKELVDACFNTPTGQLVKINLNGQAILIKVVEKTAPISKVKLAYIQVPIIASEKTINTLDSELNRFVSQFEKGQNFIQKAEEQGYNIIPHDMISSADITIGQQSGTREVVRWAFSEKPGDIKKFDFTDKRVVALLESQIEGKYLPLSEVYSSLRAEIVKEKKAEKMISELKAKNLSSLQDYALASNSKVDTIKYVNFASNSLTGLGYEPIVLAYASVDKENKVIAPVKGNNGVLALQYFDKEELSNTSTPEEIKNQIEQQLLYRIGSQSISALQTKMNVKDNRVKFF